MLQAQLVQGDLGVGPGVVQAGLHGHVAGGVVVGILLDAQVGRNFADDVAYNRGHDLAGIIMDPAGVIQQDEHLDLGVVDGQHGGKAHGLVVVAVAAQVAVGTFGSAGLAADAVACHVGVLAGVADAQGAVGVNVVLHHREDLLADFLGDDLTADAGVGLADDVARIVGDGIHDIRGDQVAAVGDGRNGGSHLHGGDGLVLAESGGVQVGVDLGHLLGVVHAGPAGLAGQVNTGGLGKTEGPDIIVKHGRLQGLRRLDKPEVAAVIQRLGHVLQGMHLAVGAVVGVLPQLAALVDGQLTVAVEGLVHVHDAGIQTCRCGDKLKDRAGHVQLGDVLILPLGFAQHTLQLGVFAGNGIAIFILGGFLADNAIRDDAGHVLLTQAALQPIDVVGGQGVSLVQDGLHLVIVDGHGVVGVELLQRGHGQDRAGLDVHHDSAAAAVDGEGIHGFGQIFFHDGLHIFVQRQVQVVAVDGVVDVGLGVGQNFAVDVGLSDAAARRTGQIFLVGFLQAVSADELAIFIVVAEADDRRRKRTVGVAAGGGLLGGEDGDAVAGLPFLFRRGAVGFGVFDDGVGHRFFHVLGHHTVLVQLAILVAGGQFGVDVIGGSAVVQQLGDMLGAGADLGFRGAVLLGLGRVSDDVPHGVAFGQQLAVGTVNVAAGGGQLGVLELLGHGLGAVVFGIAQLQGVQLVDEQAKCPQRERRHRNDGADADVAF